MPTTPLVHAPRIDVRRINRTHGAEMRRKTKSASATSAQAPSARCRPGGGRKFNTATSPTGSEPDAPRALHGPRSASLSSDGAFAERKRPHPAVPGQASLILGVPNHALRAGRKFRLSIRAMSCFSVPACRMRPHRLRPWLHTRQAPPTPGREPRFRSRARKRIRCSFYDKGEER